MDLTAAIEKGKELFEKGWELDKKIAALQKEKRSIDEEKIGLEKQIREIVDPKLKEFLSKTNEELQYAKITHCTACLLPDILRLEVRALTPTGKNINSGEYYRLVLKEVREKELSERFRKFLGLDKKFWVYFDFSNYFGILNAWA